MSVTTYYRTNANSTAFTGESTLNTYAAYEWGQYSYVLEETIFYPTVETYTIQYYNESTLLNILTQSNNGTVTRIYRRFFSDYDTIETGTLLGKKLGNTYIYSSINFTLNTYSLPGYNNLSWNTASNFSGTTYNLNTTYTTSNPTNNLYLNKTAKVYTVAFNSNGGTISQTPTPSSSATYNTSYTLPSVTKTNNTFNGWFTNAGLTYGPYIGTINWTIDNNTTFYAKFTINNFTLTYNPNGKGTGKAISVTAATSTTTPILKAVGYTFGGWYTDIATTTPIGGVSTTYTMPSANTTLYAKWTDNTKIRLSDLLNTYGNINTGNSTTSISEYQNILGITASTRTSFNTNLKGKGPAPP